MIYNILLVTVALLFVIAVCVLKHKCLLCLIGKFTKKDTAEEDGKELFSSEEESITDRALFYKYSEITLDNMGVSESSSCKEYMLSILRHVPNRATGMSLSSLMESQILHYDYGYTVDVEFRGDTLFLYYIAPYSYVKKDIAMILDAGANNHYQLIRMLMVPVQKLLTMVIDDQDIYTGGEGDK